MSKDPSPITSDEFRRELARPQGWVTFGLADIAAGLVYGYFNDGPEKMITNNIEWFGISSCFVAGGAIWWVFGKTFSAPVLWLLTAASVFAILVITFVLGG